MTIGRMKMWVLSVWPKGASGSVDLMFDREAPARAHFNAIESAAASDNEFGTPDAFIISDDYGTSFVMKDVAFAEARLVDYEKSLTAQTQLTVLQTRAQAKAQTAAMNDPAVRFAAGGGT